MVHWPTDIEIPGWLNRHVFSKVPILDTSIKILGFILMTIWPIIVSYLGLLWAKANRSWTRFNTEQTICYQFQIPHSLSANNYLDLGAPQTEERRGVIIFICITKSCFYITCVLPQLFSVASMSTSLCSSFLPTLSLCLIWAPSSWTCLTLEPLLGVSALVCPLVGVEGGWTVLRGLILMGSVWVSAWGLRRRLVLRGLSWTGEAGRSGRNFLRGVRLMFKSTADAVCFLFVGVETSWKKGKTKVWALNQLQDKSCIQHPEFLLLSLRFLHSSP